MSAQSLPPSLEPAASESNEFVDVCGLAEIVPGTGVAALVDGEQIALVRTRDGRVYAISNYDPFSRAFVLARGIVGDKNGVPKIASPIYKQNFNLETGECLDTPEVRVPVYRVRVSAGRVQVWRPESGRPA